MIRRLRRWLSRTPGLGAWGVCIHRDLDWRTGFCRGCRRRAEDICREIVVRRYSRMKP